MPTSFSFPASGVASAGGLLTLMAIEQAVARRVGPNRLGTDGMGEAVSSVLADSTQTLAYFDALKSTSNPGGVSDLFMLRRGYKSDGTTVAVSAGDRQRIAAAYQPLDGSVAPDRPWTTAPVDGELIEFHHLDPANELRPSVLAGLRRCYFEDRATVTLTGAAAERDVTAVVSWITRRAQIRRIQFTATGSVAVPDDQEWWHAIEKGGHVWLAGWPDQYPNTLLITALRPHFTWVNGADSSTGPTADADLLSVDLAYATAAGHIEAWRLCKPRLLQAASAGFQDTQADAASEFSRQAANQVKRPPRQYGLTAPFTLPHLSRSTR